MLIFRRKQIKTHSVEVLAFVAVVSHGGLQLLLHVVEKKVRHGLRDFQWKSYYFGEIIGFLPTDGDAIVGNVGHLQIVWVTLSWKTTGKKIR